MSAGEQFREGILGSCTDCIHYRVGSPVKKNGLRGTVDMNDLLRTPAKRRKMVSSPS